MYTRLKGHLIHIKNISVPEHFDFRKCISSEDVAIKLTEKMLKSINQNVHVGDVFCDLAKAFDNVINYISLAKLHFYGIEGIAAK
jgi:hypothetical protein